MIFDDYAFFKVKQIILFFQEVDCIFCPHNQSIAHFFSVFNDFTCFLSVLVCRFKATTGLTTHGAMILLPSYLFIYWGCQVKNKFRGFQWVQVLVGIFTMQQFCCLDVNFCKVVSVLQQSVYLYFVESQEKQTGLKRIK